MANTKSAKKAARQTVRRTEANKARRSRARSYARKVEEAIASGDKAAAAAALKAAEPVLARTAQKGLVHRKTASRKVSRLAKRVSAMASAWDWKKHQLLQSSDRRAAMAARLSLGPCQFGEAISTVWLRSRDIGGEPRVPPRKISRHVAVG